MSVCSHCGFESEKTGACPLCGSLLVGSASELAAPDALQGESVPAWEDGHTPFPESLFRTWRHSVFRPTDFFACVPWDAAAVRPLLYYLVLAIVAAVFGLWWDVLGVGLTEWLIDPELRVWSETSPLMDFFVTPFAALISWAVWSGVLHLSVLILARGRRGFTATTRVVAYAAGPAAATIVPLAGPLVAFVGTVFLQILGIRAAHRTGTGRAAAIVLVPMAVMTMTIVAVTVIVVLALGFAMGGL